MAPVFVEVSDITTATAQQVAALSCEAIGKPVPTIQWSRNGTILSNNETGRIVLISDVRNNSVLSTLMITAVEYDDRGEYVCTVSNLHGVINATVQLNVQGKSSNRFSHSNIFP